MAEDKIQELLIPRYKVIAGWPEMEDDEDCQVGKILTDVDSSNLLNTDYLDKFPHLFKKLFWWEERKHNELPEYVRWNGAFDPVRPDFKNDSIFKIENWYSNPNTNQMAGVYVEKGNRLFIQHCQPATESEYLNQKH